MKNIISYCILVNGLLLCIWAVIVLSDKGRISTHRTHYLSEGELYVGKVIETTERRSRMECNLRYNKKFKHGYLSAISIFSRCEIVTLNFSITAPYMDHV